jgi:hypothetical protein
MALVSYLFSLVLSRRIGDLSADPLLILQVLHPLVWFSIAIMIATMVFLSRFNNFSPKINPYLLLAVLVPLYTDLTYRYIIALPLSRELYHSAGMFYILKHGNANFPAFLQPETVAPRILGAVFAIVTSIDPLVVISYMPAFFYPGLFSVSAYVVARKFQISKFMAMLAAVYGISLYFATLGMDRSTYSMPLYVLTAVPIIGMMEPRRLRSNAIVFLLLLFSLAISDMQFLILMPTLALIPLTCYFAKTMKIESVESLKASTLFVNSAILTFVTFVGWNLYSNPVTAHAFEIPRVLFDRFVISLSGEWTPPSFAGDYNPQFLLFMRVKAYLTAVALMMSVILLLYFLVRRLQLKENSGASVFDVDHWVVLLAYFIPTSLLMIVSYKRTTLLWISLMTVYMLYVLLHGPKVSWLTKTLRASTLSFIMIVLLLSPAITWTTSEMFISVKESSMLRYMEQALPNKSIVLAVHERGDMQAGLNYIFSDREDIAVFNFFYRPIDVLSKLDFLEGDASKYSVTMVGSVIHSGAVYNVDVHMYISKLLNMSDGGSLNLVYSLGDPYYVFSKS